MSKVQGRSDGWSAVGNELDNISPVYQLTYFCECLVGSIQVACTNRKYIYEIEQRRTASQFNSNERHLKVSYEELTTKWNIGLETARNTMNATAQQVVRTSMYPMHRKVRVDNLEIHQKRLKGTWYTDTLISKVKSILGNTVANV